MQDPSWSPESQVACFLGLFDGRQRRASFTYLNEAFYRDIARALASRGDGLERLDLGGVWLKGEDMRTLAGAMRTLGRTLTCLTVRYVATDELLRAVGKGCAVIRALDFSGSSEVCAKMSPRGFQHHDSNLITIAETLEVIHELVHQWHYDGIQIIGPV